MLAREVILILQQVSDVVNKHMYDKLTESALPSSAIIQDTEIILLQLERRGFQLSNLNISKHFLTLSTMR